VNRKKLPSTRVLSRSTDVTAKEAACSVSPRPAACPQPGHNRSRFTYVIKENNFFFFVCIWRTALIAHYVIPISFLAKDSVTVETNVIFVVTCDCRRLRIDVLSVYEMTKD
jgi:hypothetical protein